MDIQNLVPVDYSNQRVLTYNQVAEGLNCSVDQLRSLFRSHQDEFQESVHFFNVTGNDLHTLKKEMRNRHADSYFTHTLTKGVNQIHAVSFGKGAKCLKLWTHQGVARLSKLIDTPQAWELFTALEKHYFNPVTHVAPHVETSLFPDEEQPPVKKTLKPLVPVAVVYAVLFANMLVKIGITSDFYRRLKELRKETHQDIVAFVTTPFKALDDARLLELTLKAKFFDRLVKGEFFNIDFEIVKAAILAEDKVNKLLAIADRLPDSEEKTRLVLQAASLI